MCSEKIDFSKIIWVTNRKLCNREFLQQVERVCKLSPQAVILREKDLSEEEYKKLAEEVLKICKKYSVKCILHTYVQVANSFNVKEVHLPLFKLREMSSEEKNSFECIGASIHSKEEAIEAQRLGASYVTAGHVFQTDCKKDLEPRGLTFLEGVCQSVEIPVYAIGGINLESNKLSSVLDCGAAGACVMSGLCTY